MKALSLITLYFFLFNFSYLTAQVNTDFWEKIETRIANPATNQIYHTIDDFDNGSFSINNKGLMLISYNGIDRGLYISSDGGETWNLNYGKLADGSLIAGYKNFSAVDSTFYSMRYKLINQNEYIYYTSKDGVNWEKTPMSKILNKNLYTRNISPPIKLRNGTLKDFLLKQIGWIYHPDGSIKADTTKRILYFDSKNNIYSEDKPPLISFNHINVSKRYYSCDGTYYSATGGSSYFSNNDKTYKPLITGFFELAPTIGDPKIEDIRVFFVGGKMFVEGKKKGEKEKFIYTKESSGKWIMVCNRRAAMIYNYFDNRIYLLDLTLSSRSKKISGLYRSKEKFSCSKEVIKTVSSYGTTVITHDLSLGIKDDLHLNWTERMATEIIKKAGYGIVYKYRPTSGNLDIMIDASNGRPVEEREDIVLFDWSTESGIKEKGFTAAAAEALYLALTKLNKGKINLQKMHFIGHGRGCIVNSLAVEKFYQLESENNFSIDQITNLGPYEFEIDMDDEHPEVSISWPEDTKPNNGVVAWRNGSISDNTFIDTYYQKNGKQLTSQTERIIVNYILDLAISQIENYIDKNKVSGDEKIFIETLLSVFTDKKISVSEAKNENEVVSILDETANYISEIPLKHAKIASLVLKNIAYAILFYESYINSNTNSREVQSSSNYLWSSLNTKTIVHNPLPIGEPNHISIIDAYIESIKKAEYGKCTYGPQKDIGGYCLSRINNGNGHRIYKSGELIKKKNYYNNFKYSSENIDRIHNIFNGSFDRVPSLNLKSIAPGWSFHGGKFNNEGPTLSGFLFGSANLEYFPNTSPVILKHNRFFIPQDANSISFQIKSSNVKDGNLILKIKDVLENKTKEVLIPIRADIVSFVEKSINVSAFKEKVVTLSFQFSSKIYDESKSISATLILDDVKLSKKIAASHKTSAQAASSSKIIIQQDNSEATVNETTSSTPLGISNPSFESLEHWSYSGGEVWIDKETIALKPTKKKQPVILKNTPFIIPSTSNQLTFLINKKKLKKAILKLEILETENQTTTTLFKEKIKISALESISDELDKISTTLESSTFDAYKKEFEKITVDIRKYKGKKVQLIFSYIPLGGGKPKLSLDEFLLTN